MNPNREDVLFAVTLMEPEERREAPRQSARGLAHSKTWRIPAASLVFLAVTPGFVLQETLSLAPSN